MKCVHCYPDASIDSPEPELTENQQIAAIKTLANAGVKCVILSGGEVLIIKHILKLITTIVSYGMKAWICTNGVLVTPMFAAKLKDSGISMVSVSIDGIDASTHDVLRECKGAFENAINAIGILSSKDIPVMVDYTATKINVTNLKNLRTMVQNTGAKKLNIKRFRPLGRGRKNIESLQLSLGEYGSLMEDYFYNVSDSQLAYTCTDDPAIYAYLRTVKRLNIENSNNLKSRIGCMAGLGWFGILSNGDITPCPLLKIPIGNIIYDDLKSIFSTTQIISSILDRTNRKGACGSCPENNNCGGCRAHAFAVSGDLLGEDPFCLIP
jgi:radical SAM protein with 4Fe4S-binding SPASM domain